MLLALSPTPAGGAFQGRFALRNEPYKRRFAV